jgi:hypothetical protein
MEAPQSCAHGKVVSAIQQGHRTSRKISKLKPDTKYAFRVCSVTYGQRSTYVSAGIVTTTLTAPPVMTPPKPAQLTLWLVAGQGAVVDEYSNLKQWQDQSGLDRHAEQTKDDHRPQVEKGVANGNDAVKFDGIDDFIGGDHKIKARTVAVVFKVDSELQYRKDLGQLWGQYAGAGHVALDTRKSNKRGFSFDGDTQQMAKYRLDAKKVEDFSENSNQRKWKYDRWHMVIVEFEEKVSIKNFLMGTLGGKFAVGEHQFGGFIAEVLVYDKKLKGEEGKVLENYLASKYAL